MDPAQIPQMLRDIADALEQILGGGGQAAPAAPADLTGMMPAGGGAPEQQG